MLNYLPIQNQKNANILRFTFYALNTDSMAKVRKALFMFVDLFGLERFDYETLVRFTITVKKNYRKVSLLVISFSFD